MKSLRALLLIAATSVAALANAQSLSDSTKVPAPPVLTASACPNIWSQWYATVPAGYTKDASGNCIPTNGDAPMQSSGSCPAGTTLSADRLRCECPAGQTYVSGACGAAPTMSSFSLAATATIGSSAATSWSAPGATSSSLACSGVNAGSWTLSPPSSGSGGVAATRPGSTTCTFTANNAWGSATASRSFTAACPTGQVWSSTTNACGSAANVTGFSIAATATVGSNAAMSWTISGATSASVSCSGAVTGSWSLSPVTGGSSSVPVTKTGTGTCTVTAVSPYGNDTASDTTSASCPAGYVWSASTNACGRPAGSAATPTFTLASTATTGSTAATSWSVSGATSTSVSCTGSVSGSWSLSPAAGGTASLPVSGAGAATCTLSASNVYGSMTPISRSLTASCPAGTSWNGSSCVTLAYPSDTLVNKRFDVTLDGVMIARVTGNPDGTVTVQKYHYDWSAVETWACTIPKAGGTCSRGLFVGSPNVSGPRDAQATVTPHRGTYFAEMTAVTFDNSNSTRVGTFIRQTQYPPANDNWKFVLNSDGSVGIYGFFLVDGSSGAIDCGGGCSYSNVSGQLTVSKAQLTAQGASATYPMTSVVSREYSTNIR